MSTHSDLFTDSFTQLIIFPVWFTNVAKYIPGSPSSRTHTQMYHTFSHSYSDVYGRSLCCGRPKVCMGRGPRRTVFNSTTPQALLLPASQCLCQSARKEADATCRKGAILIFLREGGGLSIFSIALGCGGLLVAPHPHGIPLLLLLLVNQTSDGSCCIAKCWVTEGCRFFTRYAK